MKASTVKTHWTFRLLALLMLCISGCTISPRVATSSPSSQGGTIAFSSTRALNGNDAPNTTSNIWTTDTGGSSRALTTLTAANSFSASPVWSPDGARIAYESMRALDGSNASIPVVNIWVMNADGSVHRPLTKVTAQSASSMHAAWSPDGSKIAYDSTRALDGSNNVTQIANIWIMNSDGTLTFPLTTLTAAGAASVSPSWSPDGKKIMFVSSRALSGVNASILGRNIWTINPDGTGAQAITRLTSSGNFDPAWSPDGKSIVFVSSRALNGSDTAGTAPNVWVMNADGSSAAPLTRLTTRYNLSVEDPAWSPDGKRIAYVSSRALDGNDTGGSVLNIWVMNADGSGARAHTSFLAANNYQPEWSADSSGIVFCSTRALDGSDAPNANATWNLWLMNSDGSSQRPLTRNTAAGADSMGPQWKH